MAQGLERIPLAVDSDFQTQPVRANFPEAPAQDFKLVSFEPDQQQAQPAPQPRSLGTVAADTAYGMAKGAGSLAKGIGWLAGSDGLQQAGQDAEDYWGEKQSADLHRQLEAVGKAEGVSGTVASLWNNPGAIGDYIATSLPMMVPGMAVGNLGARGIIAYAGNAARGAALRAGATEAAAMQAGRIAAEKAAEKAATRFAIGANMLGEGAVSGGVTGAEVEKFALEHGATPEQAKAAANKSALMAGAWTTAGAGIGAGMETRAMLGRLKDSGVKGMVKNVAKEAAEEAIQNPGEDYAAYAGKVQFDPTQTFDAGKAATLGAVTGGAMGAGFHAAGRAGTIMRGERENDNTDGAIPADEIGAGPGGSGSGAIEGTVLGPEQIADQRGGPITTRQPETYSQITPTALPRLALPAPEEGGPSDRQVSTAIGLLKHSPKASPELLQRLMRVDQTMAAMLFNHWQGQTNGQVAGNQATEIPAAGDQGQGADIAGSRVMDGFSDGAVSFAPGTAAESTAPGGEPGMAVGAAGPDAVALAAARPWDQTNRNRRGDEWFEGARANEAAIAGFTDALASGGANLQAHGMGKERTLGGGIQNLLNMLSNGLDANRGGGILQTAPLVSRPGEGLVGATASGSAYSDGPFMLVARPGESLSGDLSGLGAILINQAHADIAPQISAAIRAIRPDIIVAPYSEAGSIAKQLSSAKVGAGGTAVTPLDVQAHAAATSPFNATPQPTEAQKQAGNYKVGRIKFQGMDISIENPAGSVRSGTDEDGKAWETQIQHHYGYIKGTVGKDKDHLDVFIKPGAQSARTAYVIDQISPKTGKFDEHKIVFGADSEADAQAIYHANYEQGWQGMGAITAMPIEQFKDWIKSGKTKKPVAYTEPKGVSHEKPVPKAKAPAAIDPSAPYGKVGVAPFSSQVVGLQDNGDGTATVMRGEEPFYDFENGDPVTVKAGATAEQVRKAVTDAGALSSRDKWFGVAKTETKPAETGTEPAKSVTEPTKPPEQDPAADVNFLASIRAEFRHEGFRIYPISIRGEARWAVQSLDNADKEQKGERQIGGDAIVDTAEQAKKQAEDQVTERAKKAERQREFAKQDAADEAKREANRGLSITERRANAALDKPTNLPANAGVGRGPRREAMESAVSQGRAIVATNVSDTAAYKRDEDEQGRLHRAGYGAFFGNDSHPQKMRFNELTAKLKNRDNYQKKEYRLYSGRDTDGGFYEITKTEYDYAKSLMTDSSNAKPGATIAGKPVVAMPAEQLQKIASGESKTFGKAAVDKAAAELARRDEVVAPKPTKEPWQYGELEFGDKYIDEVVLPQLRKELENAHGGRFQEYPSKAAAVRGLKERIDTLENHRDAKARKYYASLDDHYAAVRRALADGKEVPEKAYESYDDLKGDVSAGRIKGDGQEVARVEQQAALKDIIAKREAEVEAVNQDYAAKYAGLQKELGKLNSSITVVKGKTEKRAAINEQAGDLRRSSEQQIRDILNRYHEIIKDHPEELARRAESSRKTREMKAEIAAQHIEAGQAEPATAPVIAASIKESAKNTPMNIEQAREWLLKQIDAALIDAKSAAEEDVWDRAEGKVDLKGRMDVKETIGYKVFDVPGDGRFSVLNLKESLQKFKKQVAATPGFKKNATRPMSVANGSGGKTSVRDMLEDGEYVLAVDYGHLTGKPLLFGAAIGNNAHPVAYTDAEPVDIGGVDAQVGREWNQTGKSFMWRVIETTTGAMISSESTKEKAISKVLAKLDEHGVKKLIDIIKETPKVSQAELERQFTDWGSKEEARAQKTRDAVERADAEDRALWNSIWPLEDGENRSPNPWNDIDHLQVAVLVKDADKAGKGDEFVSLIERRRGGTNNILALAARKALADAAPRAKPAKGAISTGVASKILGDIYQRAAYNKWTWDRLKSYLTRELEEAGVGKSRMANALEKAMTEYARTANGRLGYPNSNLVFSAMRDYGLIAEDAPDAQQESSVDYKGFERTPTGNGNFTLKDGNLLVKVEAMGSGKFQASHGSAKSSPHINSEQGAVDWAENLRDASKKTTAYPFYSGNKLFNAEGTAELPKDWTGVARSDSGKRFFYLGQENGERSFNPLKAESYEDALKEAEGLKNDKPVIPEGYREVARGYFGGTVEKPIYAPFAEGERVRFIGGHAGQIQSFIGGPVTTGAIIKYDNGLTGRAEWRDVEAVKKPAAEQEPKNFKSIDTLNAANNPLGEDDWIRFADGSEWQVKGRMNGWVLMQGKTEHPTVKNIMGQVPLIRAVVEANDAAQKPKEAAFDVDAEGGHSWSVIKAHSEWVRLGKNQWHYRFEGMGQGVVIDTHAEEGRSGENKWRTSDGELHVGLAEAKAHEIETHVKPKLIENGYLNDAAPPASIAGKPVSEMSDGMLNQIAKSSQPAAEKAKAEVARRKKPKADPLAAVREFYTQGNIIHVDYWNQHDKVLEFKEGDLPGQWNVKVIQVVKNPDGQWGPKDERMEPARWHATAPGKDKIVDRVAMPTEQDRDSFTLERLNGDAMEPMTFERGEYVRYTLSGKDQFGDIDGISHARREFSVDGLWYPFGFAYKAERPAPAKPKDAVPLSSVVEAANKKHGEGLTDADRVPSQNQARRENPNIKTTLAEHDATVGRLRDGTATLAEYKAAFQRLQNSTEELTAEFAAMKKDDILKHMGGMAASRYKSDTKAQVVTMAVRDLMDDFSIGRGISYSMGGRDAYASAVRAQVERTTDADLAEYAEHVKSIRAAQTERVAQVKAAMKDPKTLDDFEMYLRAKMADGDLTLGAARMTMTPEQRVAFDELAAEKSRAERKAKGDQQRTEVRAPGEAVGASEIIKTKHTKHGHDLWQFTLERRVPPDEFKSLVMQAKRMGGDYSSYRGNGAIPGWQFRTEEAAIAFRALVAGDTTAAKEVMQTRRDDFEDDRSQSAVERLTEMADRLEERADESLNRDRKENTDRRARMAASAEAAANSDKSLAKTMRNIAQAIESGKTKFLDRVRQKAQVEMLRGFLHTAKANELRAKFPNYGDQEKHRGAAPTAETADYVDFPRYTAFRSDLATMGRQMLDIDGAKKTGASLLKVADDVSAAYLAFAKEHLHQVSTFKKKDSAPAIFASKDDAETAIKRSGFKGKAVVLPFKRGQNIIIMSPSAAKEAGIWKGDDDKRITLTPDFGEEVVAKVKEFSSHRISMPYLFESVRAERARLKAIGIETAPELRSALREFMDLRAAPPEVDKIKQMERAMIGRKNDGLDFFPTPASVADELVQAAGIEEGMAVLEPSAGMGHIAERIRAAGVDPDVVEMASDRRELLEAKGFRLVGSDFMDMSPRGFTYGDVFRAQDGTLGVMRGSGGMGSNRVGLDPLDANGNPEPRRMGWYDRDELEGVEKRAGNSGYDRIIMNPPFSDRRDAEHVQHAYTLLKPGGRLVAIMGEGVFFGQDKKAQAFRDWLEEVGGTSEKLEEGTFLDPSLPVNTGVNARMVVVEKGEGGAIADPSSSAPGQFTSPRLGNKFANAGEAVEWLAQNMDGEGYRHVAQKILPVVRSVPIHYVSVGDTVPAKVAELLSSGSAAVAYQAGDITDGKDAIYVLEGKGDTEEGLLHEALHIATSRRLLDATAAAEFSDMAKAIRSSLYDAGAKSTDQKFKQAVEFFRREFRSPGELVAYGFSSPAFQDLLKLMAADGKFYTDYRTPEQLAKVNKNASFQPQKRIPAPAYSMWHRFVDAVRALFGGPKAYQEAYERATAANAAIDRNNELASRVEFETLEEKLNSLLDALLQRPELGLSKGGAAQPIRGSGLESRSRSTGFASTESTRAIQSIVDKFLKQFAGAADLDIRVARTVADIPERFRPSPFAEGTFNDDAGLIYLVAMNLKHPNGQINTGRVWQVLMHEAVGHAGLAKMMGSRFSGILKEVMRAARAKGEVGEDIYEPGHPDYATIEAVRLRYTTASDEVLAEEVLARMAETDPGRTLFGYVRAVVRQWLRDMARAAGITIDVTTAELNDLVAQASRYMRRGDGVAQGVDVDALGVADMAVGGMASKATGMESRAAPTAGQPKEPRTGMLDTILRKAGGELAAKITGPAYDKLTAYLGGKMPEGVKAGMVSDYGLDEAYVDRRTGMQTEQQKAARQTKTFVEGLMGLDRAQSRVAYQWLNNRGAEADRLMAQLPAESQQVLKDIKIQIAKLTIEAVRLGQLDAETASRNFLAYLHRSYAKYDLNTDDKTWKAERAKAIKILGDQYKGRGLKMEVDPDRIHSAPGWWKDEMKGKRVKVLKNDAGRFAFVAEGTAIPPTLAGYKLEGVWEIRARKADNRIALWRDFTEDERQMMGELDEAKYAVARTLFMMNRDIEVGRFHEWVADEYAKTPEEAEEEGLQMADASESMMRAFTPDEWVTVPTSKIPGTGVFKFGALAGMVVPGPVWNDIRQISAGRFEPFGAAYASILRAWKLSKTALTPTTHVNNIMGNFVMADMHDVGARDAIAAVRLMVAAANGDKDAKAMLDRFEDSGATQGMFTTHELKKEVLEPLLQQLREEVGMADDEAAILKVSAIMSLALHGQFGEAWAGAKAAAKQSTAGRVTGAVVTKAQDYYQAEDSVFRLAAFLKSIDEGKTDQEAGKLARKAFLDYHINAPWINAMRGTAMPFIAFAYRAIPMLAETAAKKPWKIAKYMLVAGGLNALAYAMLGADADEDKERAYLPDEKAGRLWGIVPKLIRMPWNRESKLRDGRTTSDPVFLDVRRWIPVGDVVDYGQDKTALPMIPQPLIPGGPLIMAAEFLVNKSAFTGKELTKETDTWVEKAAKVGGHFYKGFAPNVPIPYSGTWAGTKIDNAIKGKEDPLGRAYPVPEAVASGFGLKLERYPVDTLQRNAVLDMKGKLRELDAEKKQAARDYGRNGMQKVELDEKISDVVAKKNKVVEEYKAKERKAMGKTAP